MSNLPPGQRPGPHRRFGLPAFASRSPASPARPGLDIRGEVEDPTRIDLAALFEATPRREIRADLHCVTTWTAPGLRWSGVPFAAAHHEFSARTRPDSRCDWVTVTGLDGYRCCAYLPDLLDDDVLLADRLDDTPLSAAGGAPLRLVAPRLYGYKSVRAIGSIAYRTEYESGSAGWMEHPRGRVAWEERSRVLPGRVWRPVWRALLPLVRRRYARTAD